MGEKRKRPEIQSKRKYEKGGYLFITWSGGKGEGVQTKQTLKPRGRKKDFPSMHSREGKRGEERGGSCAREAGSLRPSQKPKRERQLRRRANTGGDGKSPLQLGGKRKKNGSDPTSTRQGGKGGKGF